jgi:proteasome accessory factor A
MRQIVSEDEIKRAIFTPPNDTRAFFRGRSVAKFNDQITSIQWDAIVFANGALPRRVSLSQPFDDKRLDALNATVRDAGDYLGFIRSLSSQL